MKIMAFDIGSNCGWAVIEDGSYISGGTHTVSYPTKKQEREGVDKAQKWVDFQDWSSSIIGTISPGAIFFEDVKAPTSTLAAYCYGFFRYTIQAECARRKIPCYPIGVGSWKKVSHGKGNAEKHQVAEVMAAAYGIAEFESEDHSDAVGICHAGSVKMAEGKLEELLSSAGGKKKKKKKSASHDGE